MLVILCKVGHLFLVEARTKRGRNMRRHTFSRLWPTDRYSPYPGRNTWSMDAMDLHFTQYSFGLFKSCDHIYIYCRVQVFIREIVMCFSFLFVTIFSSQSWKGTTRVRIFFYNCVKTLPEEAPDYLLERDVCMRKGGGIAEIARSRGELSLWKDWGRRDRELRFFFGRIFDRDSTVWLVHTLDWFHIFKKMATFDWFIFWSGHISSKSSSW